MTITPALLLHGYSIGIFPMAEGRDTDDLFWVDPRRRGILPLDGFHISRSLARRMRRGGYVPAIDADFAGTLRACADRDETWINAPLFDLYMQLNAMGRAHSFEIRDDAGLIGAVFGVTLGAAFFGESMVSLRTDGSKLALAHLVDHLRRAGFLLFDTQFITPHLASLGAIEISRVAYHRRLEKALAREGDFIGTPLETDPYSVLQRNTQTS
ncbi:leucyl/phenylalanyl-tRNA--protein transferase [Marimonas lutisalis]|uniref:leucyl/phenylalanyl-tRNA--protein transferase n=1 Tax=Marimonas lutisalis TaxID=2545756 RepID=UPI0010FA3AD8|nr:leucyl/phenylalanyl-tRNA--protein transferase [Marimonas lutisalis]